jgi:ABC-type sulfate/molybdate transport systems ATPase subunit
MQDATILWKAEIRVTLGSLEIDVAMQGGRAPVALIGPNGAGKTSILRILAGAHRATTGRFELGGDVLFDRSDEFELPPEARRVGYVPQGYGLFPHLTVLDNVMFGFKSSAPAPRAGSGRQAAAAMLHKLGCVDLAERHPGALSGGEQQRVALARALVAEPRMLLLDEPLAALDAIARRQLRAFVAEHLGTIVQPTLVVTHDVRDVMALNAEVYALDSGQLVQSGPWAELAAQPATEFVREFFDLHGPTDTPQPAS